MKLFNWLKKSYPLIGKEILWKDSMLRIYKVIDFDRAGTVVTSKGQVIAKSFDKPYGYLIVECPFQFDGYRKLPIIHQDDFLLASSVFDDEQFSEKIKNEQELLVTYFPEKYNSDGFSLSASHVLHYVLTPIGTIEKYYDRMLSTSKLSIESIFGYFIWTGEIGVKVNQIPVID